MNNTNILELPELPSEPDVIQNARIPLLEDFEKFEAEEIRKKDEHPEDKRKHDLDSERKHEPVSGSNYDQQPDQKQVPKAFVPDPDAPRDKGYFVLIVIGLFGLVHLIPFIFIFQANEYWMYKFRNTTSDNSSGFTFLQTNFFSLLKIVLTVPGVVCTFIAAIGGHKIKPQTRVFAVLFIHSSILVFQAVFANINTDQFAMSMGGSGSMGLIAKLPPRYMKADLMGQGITSIFSGFLRLISIFSTPSTIDAALTYFCSGAVLMGGNSLMFYFASQTTFFKYYTKDYKEERKQKIRNVGDFKAILKILWPILILSIIPLIVPVTSLVNIVQSEYKGENTWGDKYFVTVCTYLVPAVAGVVGRGIFNYMDYDCSLPMLYLIVISKESIFGVLTLLSNAQPRNHLPVLLTHDWQYAVMYGLNSLASGFTTNLLALKTMRMVPKDRIELSMMCNMFFTAIAMAVTSPLGVLVVNLL